MQTPYEQLRTRINQLMPERPALGFGCEIRIKNELRTPKINSVYYTIKAGTVVKFVVKDDDPCSCGEGYNCAPTYWWCINEYGVRFDIYTKDEDEYEILGTPLTVVDVLLALQHKSYGYVLDQMGRISVARGREAPKTVRLSLLLPVSQWGDDTLNALLTIIG